MSFLSELTEAFDERGCSGFTIWLTTDGWLQVNLRRKDNISWDCKSFPDLKIVPASDPINSSPVAVSRAGASACARATVFRDESVLPAGLFPPRSIARERTFCTCSA